MAASLIKQLNDAILARRALKRRIEIASQRKRGTAELWDDLKKLTNTVLDPQLRVAAQSSKTRKAA